MPLPALLLAILPLPTAPAPPAAAAERPLLTWPDLTRRTRPKPDATLPYGADPLQVVDVWLPKGGTAPHPVVFMVHGGCWQTSVAERDLMNWAADDLRRDGIAVWNVEYRGVDRAGGGYPGTFADVAASWALLGEKADAYHLDAARVVAVGHSAGGHLALWLAGARHLPAISPLHATSRATLVRVISLGGLPDLEATAASPDNGCGTEVVGRLIGHGRVDPYGDTSVPRLLPLGVPQDLVNGREDTIIPYRLATDYVAKARAAGDAVTLHTVPDTGHVELIAPETAAWRETKRLIRAAFK